MLPKHHIILYSNYVKRVIRVILSQMHQYFQLYPSLMLKSLFIPYQLYSHILLSLMIVAFNSLTETSLAKKFNNFKSICDMVFEHDLIVTSLVVIAKVIGVQGRSLDLLGFNAKVVDLLVVEDLSFLVVCQVSHEELQCFSRGDRVL
jgi:hypothetical protein